MKKFLIIIFLTHFFYTNAQNYFDSIAKMQTTEINNKIKLITLDTKSDSIINFYIFIDFPPSITKYYPEEVDFISNLKYFNTQLPNLFYFSLISDTLAIDSTILFAKQKIFSLTFETSNTNTYIERKKFEILNADQWQSADYKSKSLAFQNNNYVGIGRIGYYEALQSSNISFTYNSILSECNITFIAIGKINKDSIISSIKRRFSEFSNAEKNTDQIKQFKIANDKSISVINDNKYQIFNILIKTDLMFSDTNYFAKQIVYQYITQQFNDIGTQLKTAFNSYTHPNPELNYISFSISFLSIQIFDALLNLNDIITNTKTYGLNQNELEKQKKDLIKNYSELSKKIEIEALYLFYTDKYNLPTNYFANINSKIKNVSINSVNNFAQKIDINNIQFMLISPYYKTICELMEIAQFFRIDFYDKNFNKYKIIPLGFSAQQVQNDYIDRCKAKSEIENIRIEFKSYYDLDSGYLLTGTILKKKTQMYLFKSYLLTGNDTLFHQLKLLNNRYCLDSNAVSCIFFDDKSAFWQEIYKNSFFPELFFKEAGYNAQIICDTNILKENIYKIRVSTPFGFNYIDYYNYNSKLKLKTEVIVPKGYENDTLEIIEYSDYRNISKTSDIKFPFKVIQYFPKYSITSEISLIDDKTKLKNKKFNVKIKK